MQTKICPGCKQEKPLDQYHKCKKSPLGVQPRCKKCRSDLMAERYVDNKDHILAKCREYRQTDARLAVVDGYINRNRKKNRAKDKVAYAIRRGTIQRKPCEMCGATEHVHAHHDDYDKPLEVRFLCSKHHREWHRLHGEAANPD